LNETAVIGGQTDLASQVEYPKVTAADLLAVADRARAGVAKIREKAAAPEDRKTPPRIASTKLQRLCGLDKNKFQYRLAKGKLPQGRVQAGSRRDFSLAEAIAWVTETVDVPRRPAGGRACVMTAANLKGGSTKTSTTMCLGQGLALRGHKVLVIDLDPQGTLTQFFGMLPDSEVAEDSTVGPLCLGDYADLEYAVKKDTYFAGLHLIAASPALFGAEFALPAQQVRNPDRFRFWDVLNEGLAPLRQEYDAIIIDTSPSLSYLTLNALFAADGLIVPLPLEGPAYSSLAQFWSMFTDIAGGLGKRAGAEKEYDFLHVVPSRVKDEMTNNVVNRWVGQTYGPYILPVSIPETRVMGTAALEYKTVYDIEKYAGGHETYRNARDAYDKLVRLVEASMVLTWQRTARGG
jgi:chromosome partitioning protein